VADLGEDGQGAVPRLAGGLEPAAGLVGVAEVAEGKGLVVAVAELVVQVR
jgi:hypothetical protein